MKATRHVLSAKDRFALWNLVAVKFAAANMGDKDFARYASGELHFDVNENHVMHARNGLEIPAYHAKPAQTLELRVAALESLVSAMRSELGMLPQGE